MTLVKVSDREWVLLDDTGRVEGDKEHVTDALILRLARLLSLFPSYTGGENPVTAARNEVNFALECMRQDGHNMADFGIAGHFIRTLDPNEVRLAS